MNKQPTGTAVFLALTAAMLLSAFAANAAEETPVEKPKPAIELGVPFAGGLPYCNKLVTRKTWPDEKLKIDGVVTDPNTAGKKYEWRKMPLLSTRFRDNAVFQAGVPITIWGSAVHDHGYEAEGEAVIEFSFAGIEKTIRVKSDPAIVSLGPGQSRFASDKEWRVTVPPMEASAEPKTLKVTFLIDGEVAHNRVCTNIVVGDVWHVAAPQMFEGDKGAKYGEQLSVLANCWKDRFGGEDPYFFYTIPNKTLDPKATQPKKIKGKSAAIEIGDWSEISKVIEAAVK